MGKIPGKSLLVKQTKTNMTLRILSKIKRSAYISFHEENEQSFDYKEMHIYYITSMIKIWYDKNFFISYNMLRLYALEYLTDAVIIFMSRKDYKFLTENFIMSQIFFTTSRRDVIN